MTLKEAYKKLKTIDHMTDHPSLYDNMDYMKLCEELIEICYLFVKTLKSSTEHGNELLPGGE